MNPPDETALGAPASWVRKASHDLAAADALRDRADLSDVLCFHAQQAAEKLIKGYLTRVAVDFPKTHDITALLSLMRTQNPALADRLQHASRLSEFAAASRYPGAEPSHTQALEMVALAHELCSVLRPLTERTGAEP